MQPASPALRDADRGGMVRSFAVGVTVTVALTALVWLLGAVAPELEVWLLGGTGLALLAGAAALYLNGLFVAAGRSGDPASDAAILAGRLQGLLAAAFAVKLAVLAIAAVVLVQLGVKFEATAIFCVTFAAASFVCQLTTAVSVSRSMRPGGKPESNPRTPS